MRRVRGSVDMRTAYNCERAAERKELVRPEGFEPPTLWSEARCSNPLSYGRMCCHPSAEGLFWSGREDLNLRPRRPERRALPSCATPRPIPHVGGWEG